MRAYFNRQTRRAACCIRTHSPRGRKLAISPRRLALTADVGDLSEVAARIADELELSAELLDLLSHGCGAGGSGSLVGGTGRA